VKVSQRRKKGGVNEPTNGGRTTPGDGFGGRGCRRGTGGGWRGREEGKSLRRRAGEGGSD